MDVQPGNPTIAVLIPCLNEELTIRKVVKDFLRELPEAEVHVYDNGSTDGSLASRWQGPRP